MKEYMMFTKRMTQPKNQSKIFLIQSLVSTKTSILKKIIAGL